MTSSPRSSQNDVSANSAALRGANLAFQKTLAAQSKPKPPTPSLRSNGALVAATSATRDNSPSKQTPSRPAKQTTGSTARDEAHTRGQDVASSGRRTTGQNNVVNASPGQHLLSPARSGVDPKSPSYIAATLAASRSASPISGSNVPSPSFQTPIRLRKRASFGSVSSSIAPDLEQPETDPIRPATALISMFEDKGTTGDPVKKSTPVARAGSPPKLLSPLLRRGTTPSSILSSPGNINISPIPSLKLKSRSPPQPRRGNNGDMTLSVESRPNPGQPRLRGSSALEGVPQRSKDPAIAESKVIPRLSLDIKVPGLEGVVSQETITEHDPRLEAISSSMKTSPRPSSTASGSSNDSFVSASSTKSPSRETGPPNLLRGPPPPRPPSRRSIAIAEECPSPSRLTTRGRTQSQNPPRPPTYAATPTSSTSALPLVSDAILASSLASVRAAQAPREASPPAPALPARKHSHGISSSIHRVRHHRSGSRSGGAPKGIKYHHTGNSAVSLPMPAPSPMQRNMPLTLRADRTGDKDKDEARRMKKRAKGSKRHAHSEGTRKRWRDEITTEERRRYEGLWASNKGLLVECLWPPVAGPVAEGGATNTTSAGTTMPSGHDAPQECVLNVVTRDLWRRSRLPDDELAEVWDLVDRTRRGMLARHEFVVGLWVVDQRLKGRKIPTRIQESVWDSARGVRIGNK